jgi:hypothetical protein
MPQKQSTAWTSGFIKPYPSFKRTTHLRHGRVSTVTHLDSYTGRFLWGIGSTSEPTLESLHDGCALQLMKHEPGLWVQLLLLGPGIVPVDHLQLSQGIVPQTAHKLGSFAIALVPGPIQALSAASERTDGCRHDPAASGRDRATVRAKARD